MRPVLLACAIGVAVPAATPALADEARVTRQLAPDAALRAALADRSPGEFKAFYAARGWKPLWLDARGNPREALSALLEQVDDARIDSVRPSKGKSAALRKALDQIETGNPADLARTELAATRLFVAWVQGMRGAPSAKMTYESEALAPVVPTPASVLENAAHAPSLEGYLARMGWMHPFYAPLRSALLGGAHTDSERRRLAANLERVRALPAAATGRYVLVDAAGARLWMMENGRAVDSMKVVVGKADNQTPMMAGFIRFATLNPYWNVPDDLVAQRVARNVMDKGFGYLKTGNYEILSGWEADAIPLDPSLVDWEAVASGQQLLRVRQRPGGENFMGRVKFEFPNPMGIYLHDTPAKDLMLKDERQFSSGCVRLEDAGRLGRWLMGKPLPKKVVGPEKRLPLPQPVPIYITYLTALPDATGTTVAFQPDPYSRDGEMPRLATALR